MYWTKEQLLAHLPYVYRERDAEIAAREGLSEGPLSSLFGAIAAQIGAVENICRATLRQLVCRNLRALGLALHRRASRSLPAALDLVRGLHTPCLHR